MMCLTVLQPWAHLFFLPFDHPDWKGGENRTWRTKHRGPMLIHAGVNRRCVKSWNPRLLRNYQESFPMTFGAIIGQVDVVDCFPTTEGPLPPGGAILDDPFVYHRFPWLHGHKHVEGPIFWLFTNPRRFVEPIPFRGAQGLFSVPDSDLKDARFA